MWVYDEETGRWYDDETGEYEDAQVTESAGAIPPPPPDFQAMYDKGGFAPGEKESLANTYAGSSPVAAPRKLTAPPPREIPFVGRSVGMEEDIPLIEGYGEKIAIKRPGQETVNEWGDTVSPESVKDIEDTLQMPEEQVGKKIADQERIPRKPSDGEMSVFDQLQEFDKFVTPKVEAAAKRKAKEAVAQYERSYGVVDVALMNPKERREYDAKVAEIERTTHDNEFNKQRDNYHKAFYEDAKIKETTRKATELKSRRLVPNYDTGFMQRVNTVTGEKEDTDLPVKAAVPGYRRTTTGDLEVVPGGPADVKRNKEMAADEAAVDSMTSEMDRLAREANAIKEHPGLAGITGVRGKIPNFPGSDAANAEARLNTLKSQTAFSVLQAMRNNSKTGGALGQVSDKEGKLLEENLAALDKAQSEEAFKEALQRIVDFTEESNARIKRVKERKWGGSEKSSEAIPKKPRYIIK